MLRRDWFSEPSKSLDMTSLRANVFNTLYPLWGAVTGVPVCPRLQELLVSQYWSRDQLEAFQLERLRSLLEHSYATVPYYKNAMDQAGVGPQDIRYLSDLVRLPVLTREDVQKAFPNGLVSIAARRYSVARTGGSTGSPVVFYLDKGVRAVERAGYFRFLSWTGYRIGEPMVRLWGAPVVSTTGARIKRVATRYLYWVDTHDAFRLDESMFQFVSERISRLKPTVIRGYTSALVAFAEYARSRSLTWPSVRAVTTTAEVLHDYQRTLVQEAFQCKVFDQYGCGEVNSVAADCERQRLHVAAEHAIVEILDVGGNPVAPGEIGNVALTNLDNRAMPFIRYLNGDQAIAGSGSCDCGRNLPIIGKVAGRTTDLIAGLNGKRVHGEFFSHLLHELGWTERLVVTAFRVEQHTKRTLTFDLVSQRPPSPDDIRAMETVIREFLGPVELSFRSVRDIAPGPSGKRRFTLSHVLQT
jgi:phenylacetate-CoA ligase